MKTWTYISILIFLLASSSCEDTNDLDSEFIESIAILGNYDVALCACCGGYVIEIENKDYRFESLPDDSDITLPNEGLEVEITYNIDRICGDLTYIIIEKIEKI